MIPGGFPLVGDLSVIILRLVVHVLKLGGKSFVNTLSNTCLLVCRLLLPASLRTLAIAWR